MRITLYSDNGPLILFQVYAPETSYNEVKSNFSIKKSNIE